MCRLHVFMQAMLFVADVTIDGVEVVVAVADADFSPPLPNSATLCD